ncbi:MAG: NADH-quinone oxidoreductase subunit L, partial [Actinomyces sp.]|nr:NADH-quinone oxidoreductase subunit L [Actinomyces sp.]
MNYSMLLPQAPVEATAASGVASLGWLMIAIPLAVSILLLLLGRVSDRWGHWLAVLASWSSFGIGLAIIIQMLGVAPSERSMEMNLFEWIPAGDFTVNFGLLM